MQAQEGKAVKNHMKDNLKQIRKSEEENKMKHIEEANKRDDPFKMNKFKNVQSKLGSTQYSKTKTGYNPEKVEKTAKHAHRATGGMRKTH